MENRKDWRLSISLPAELESEIVDLRKDDRYTRMSYGEIIRLLLRAGLDRLNDQEQTEQQTA